METILETDVQYEKLFVKVYLEGEVWDPCQAGLELSALFLLSAITPQLDCIYIVNRVV